MECFDPTVTTFSVDLYCEGCGSEIKAGCMVVYFPTRRPGNKFFCCKEECGGEQVMSFVLDLDNPSFT
jgi:hypothetical protein